MRRERVNSCATLEGEEKMKCSLCGMVYVEGNKLDEQQHRQHCRQVERCKRKFGYWLEADYTARERVKQENWPAVNDSNADLASRIAATKEILKMWFSRSVGESGWSLTHPEFRKWTGMFLQNERTVFPSEVFNQLVKIYPAPRLRKRKAG